MCGNISSHANAACHHATTISVTISAIIHKRSISSIIKLCYIIISDLMLRALFGTFFQKLAPPKHNQPKE